MTKLTLQNGLVYELDENGLTTHNDKPVRVRAFAKTKTARAANANEIWLDSIPVEEWPEAAKGRFLLMQEQSREWNMFTYGSKVRSAE